MKLDENISKTLRATVKIASVSEIVERTTEEIAALSTKTQERMEKAIASYMEAGYSQEEAEIATTSKVKVKLKIGKLEVSPTSKVGRMALALQEIRRKQAEAATKAA